LNLGEAATAMTWLIDLTDERFKIPVNRDVIEYIRRENPFAHSDIGAKLIELSKRLPGSNYYCPSFRSCAYVALHTEANAIFAIALGMLKIAYRLPSNMVTEAIANGIGEPSDIGNEWLDVDPLRGSVSAEITNARVFRLCEAAFHNADALSRLH
jgi:hypothetical protein